MNFPTPRFTLVVAALAIPLPGQYGAKFEPPVGRILHGVGQDSFSPAPHNKVPQYEAALGTALAPAIDKTYLTISLYLTSPRNPRVAFLSYLAAVAATGKVPEVGIDILPDTGVAAGTYDAELVQMARDFKSHGAPIYARPGVEIANSWNAYTPSVFPQAWRRMVDVFRQEGADNVSFVWCYAAAGFSTFADFDAQGNGIWYPGDEYVDWLGLDLFDATNFAGGSASHANSIALCEFAQRRKKPVMIAECTAKGLGLSPSGSAQAYWDAWFRPFFAFVERYPVVREFSYINWDWSLTSKWPTWLNADITVNSALVALYQQQLADSRYLHRSSTSPFVGPWPRRSHVQVTGQPIAFGFAGLTPGSDVWLIVGTQRYVTNPAANEKQRDYGLPLLPAGYVKVVPVLAANMGPASASGEMSFAFPAATVAGTLYVQVYHAGSFSAEIRVDY